ncbi:DUF736 domain-containing protein (plasmid) [Nitrobacteraceae bacterium UC4446_H13]
MPAIGFVNKLDDGSYRGTLRTLSISAALKIIPNKDKTPGSDQPDYRIYGNDAEIGGGWDRKNKDNGADFVALSFAAPEFGPRRLYANLGRMAGSDRVCPSSANLRLIRHFAKRGSGSSGVRV